MYRFRANLEEDNRRRLEAAEALAQQVRTGVNKNQIRSVEKKTRWPSLNNRYKTEITGNKKKIPVIRETRSSRMRKTALIADVMRREKTQLLQKTSKLSKSKEKSPALKSRNSSLYSTSGVLPDQSFEIVNSGAGSPRVNVHPDDFVTGKTYNHRRRYKTPERSLDSMSWKRFANRYLVLQFYILKFIKFIIQKSPQKVV